MFLFPKFELKEGKTSPIEQTIKKESYKCSSINLTSLKNYVKRLPLAWTMPRSFIRIVGYFNFVIILRVCYRMCYSPFLLFCYFGKLEGSYNILFLVTIRRFCHFHLQINKYNIFYKALFFLYSSFYNRLWYLTQTSMECAPKDWSHDV